MYTSLDLLVIVAMAFIAISLVALILLFLSKNNKIKKISFYAIAALSLYMGTVALRIVWPEFMAQSITALAMMAATIGAVVVESCSKGNPKATKVAEIAVVLALIVGTGNALL